MKSILTILMSSIACTIVMAQKPEQAEVRVKYEFSHMIDTNKRDNFLKETMMVVAGKNASVFLSYDNVVQEMETKAAFEQQAKEQASVDVKTFKMPPRKRQTITSAVYYYANESKFFVQEQLGALYLVERDADKINWKITAETMQIEGFSCRKATANYRGRNWIVWFSEELPFATGPWLLVGLPGLILKAHDDRNEVLFEFAALEKVENLQQKKAKAKVGGAELKNFGNTGILTSNIIELPAKATRATPEEMKKLKEVMREDPQGFARSQLAALGMGGIKPVATGTRTSTPPPATIMNNPIDKSKP